MGDSGKLKTFVLITESESGDKYSYQIQSSSRPTELEVEEFLIKNGSDNYVENGRVVSCEYQEMLIEINPTKFFI